MWQMQHSLASLDRPPKPAGFWRTLALALCIGLLLLGTTVQVAHGHAPGHSSHDDCSLCLSAHAVIAIVAAVSLLLFQTAAPFRRRPVRLRTFRPTECPYWNRPPPAYCSFS